MHVVGQSSRCATSSDRCEYFSRPAAPYATDLWICLEILRGTMVDSLLNPFSMAGRDYARCFRKGLGILHSRLKYHLTYVECGTED